MNELLALFPVLFLVYLLQCIGYAPATSIVFILGPRSRGRRIRHTFRLGRSQNQLFLNNPFIPSAGALFVDPPPFAVCRDANGELLGLEIPNSSAEGHPKQMCSLEVPHRFTVEETKVLVDGSPFLRVRTEELAQEIVALLSKLPSATPKSRSRLIDEHCRKLFSLETVNERLEEYSRNTELLRFACYYLFFCIFILAPALVFFRGLHRVWPLLLLYLAVGSWLVLWSYRRSVRLLYPLRRSRNLPQLIGIALSPFAAIRANDSLLADLLAGFHPVAVAYRILREKEFVEFAGSELRKAKYLISDLTQLYFLSEFLRKVQIDLDRLLAPPVPESPQIRSFCPVCLTQYVIDTGVCQDCGRIALQSFSEVCGESVELKKAPSH
jgi:hypothetical protein